MERYCWHLINCIIRAEGELPNNGMIIMYLRQCDVITKGIIGRIIRIIIYNLAINNNYAFKVVLKCEKS